MDFPSPPRALSLWNGPDFLPADGMDAFVRATFFDPGSSLFIPEHEILSQAAIGYLWANPEARDKNRTILGTAQLIRPPQKKWTSLRAFDQVRQWFGSIDFLITLSAPFCADPTVTPAEILALIDHELCHCCQAEKDGVPLFGKRTGLPIWGMRGHDVEQFVGVVDRWGAGPSHVSKLVEAAQSPARFGSVDLRRIIDGCGTSLQVA